MPPPQCVDGLIPVSTYSNWRATRSFREVCRKYIGTGAPTDRWRRTLKAIIPGAVCLVIYSGSEVMDEIIGNGQVSTGGQNAVTARTGDVETIDIDITSF
jgi:hypothetical protein